MGPLKENLYQAVVAHLLDSPKCQTQLTALNHPFSGSPEIRESWAALKGEEGRSEGVRKQTGLQAVLSERPDLFDFTTGDRGHQLICLTEYAQGLVAETRGQLPPDSPRPPESRVEPVAAPCTGEDAIGAGEEETEQSMAQERPAKAPRTWLASQSTFSKGAGKGPCGKGSPAPAILSGEGRVFEGGVWNGWCYTDMYWTPEMVVCKASEQQKEKDMVKALYKAVDMHAGKSVALSQLGSDYKVAEIKKDPIFKNWRLLDFLREYDQVFELKPTNGIAGGMMVGLQPGAEAALPGAEEENGGINQEELLLPDRISKPRNSREKAQALRIELMYALHRRGGKSAIQHLGQEPGVQKAKQGVQMVGKKLVEWLKLFPDNFSLACLDSTQMIVELRDADASDMSMIDRMLGRSDRQDPARDHKSCAAGASRDSGRGYRDTDRGRDRRDEDRHRGPGRDPAWGSMQAYGYPAPHYSPQPGHPPAYGGYGYRVPGYPPSAPHPSYCSHPPRQPAPQVHPPPPAHGSGPPHLAHGTLPPHAHHAYGGLPPPGAPPHGADTLPPARGGPPPHHAHSGLLQQHPAHHGGSPQQHHHALGGHPADSHRSGHPPPYGGGSHSARGGQPPMAHAGQPAPVHGAPGPPHCGHAPGHGGQAPPAAHGTALPSGYGAPAYGVTPSQGYPPHSAYADSMSRAGHPPPGTHVGYAHAGCPAAAPPGCGGCHGHPPTGGARGPEGYLPAAHAGYHRLPHAGVQPQQHPQLVGGPPRHPPPAVAGYQYPPAGQLSLTY